MNLKVIVFMLMYGSVFFNIHTSQEMPVKDALNKVMDQMTSSVLLQDNLESCVGLFQESGYTKDAFLEKVRKMCGDRNQGHPFTCVTEGPVIAMFSQAWNDFRKK